MTGDLLKLPWEIQVALASGYAAYVVAYTGLRSRHQTIDVLLITLVFSLIASLALWLLSGSGELWRGLAALGGSLTSGLVWRRWGRSLAPKLLRALNATWADDAPSALATLSDNTTNPITQVAVLLDDGTWLECRDASKFADAPHGPCVIGPNGDIALYLTHEETPAGETKELKNVRDAIFGDRITYVPASRIKRITLRYQRS